MENDCEANDQDARTIYCANLSEKITDELLFELFLQVNIYLRVKLITKNHHFADLIQAFLIFFYLIRVDPLKE